MKSSGRNIKLTSYDDLFSTEESRTDAQREKVMEIPLSELHPFRNHPFKVLDDEKMQDTAESIREYGVLVPAIARPREEGGYELIAGHRRKRGCELAGLDTMPVIVRDLDDDAATLVMVDSNIQRENILPSERAFAYRMKLEAMKRQGARNDLTSGQVGPKSETKRSSYILSEDVIGEAFHAGKIYAFELASVYSGSYTDYEFEDDLLKSVCYVKMTESGHSVLVNNQQSISLVNANKEPCHIRANGLIQWTTDADWITVTNFDPYASSQYVTIDSDVNNTGKDIEGHVYFYCGSSIATVTILREDTTRIILLNTALYKKSPPFCYI